MGEEEYEPCVREALAEGDAPLKMKLLIARESIEALERRLDEIAAEQHELSERIARGQVVDDRIRNQQEELKKLRRAADAKRQTMAMYIAKLESDRT